MKRAVVALALLLASAGLLAGQASAADAAPAGVERLQGLDQDILAGLNATRAAHGLRPLVVSEGLQEAALAHSRAMLEGGFFAHDSPDGTSFVTRLKHFYSPAGFSSWSAGENLIYNTEQLDAATAIRTWLDSPAHRANMLDPDWREVGIGSMHAASAGGTFGGQATWVVTMDFGFRTGGGTAPATQAKPAAQAKPLGTLSFRKAAKPVRKVAKRSKTSKTVAYKHPSMVKGGKPSKTAKSGTRQGKKTPKKPKKIKKHAKPKAAKPKAKPDTRETDRVLPGPGFGHKEDGMADGDDAADADDENVNEAADEQGDDGSDDLASGNEPVGDPTDLSLH